MWCDTSQHFFVRVKLPILDFSTVKKPRIAIHMLLQLVRESHRFILLLISAMLQETFKRVKITPFFFWRKRSCSNAGSYIEHRYVCVYSIGTCLCTRVSSDQICGFWLRNVPPSSRAGRVVDVCRFEFSILASVRLSAMMHTTKTPLWELSVGPATWLRKVFQTHGAFAWSHLLWVSTFIWKLCFCPLLGDFLQ